MARKKNEILKHIEQAKMPHEQIRWSNAIVNAPVVYSLLERRMLYFLTGEVKHKYVEKNLGVPASWQDLYFHLTDKDLGLIGGKTNVLNTYEALSELGKKFVPVSFRNEKGELIFGRVHWVDTFFYNTEPSTLERLCCCAPSTHRSSMNCVVSSAGTSATAILPRKH